MGGLTSTFGTTEAFLAVRSLVAVLGWGDNPPAVAVLTALDHWRNIPIAISPPRFG